MDQLPLGRIEPHMWEDGADYHSVAVRDRHSTDGKNPWIRWQAGQSDSYNWTYTLHDDPDTQAAVQTETVQVVHSQAKLLTGGMTGKMTADRQTLNDNWLPLHISYYLNIYINYQ